jgi:hypothetical protein
MQGKRTRLLDSRGRPYKGLYIRDGLISAGFNCPQTSKWRMENLRAKNATEALRERDSLLAALREDRASAPVSVTFEQLFREHQAARNLSERTLKHERHLVDRHLAAFKSRRVQSVTTAEVSRLLRDMRDGTKARPKKYAPWTRHAVYRIVKGTFALAGRRGIINRSPVDGLAASEIPNQENAQEAARLDAPMLERFVLSGTTERWRAASRSPCHPNASDSPARPDRVEAQVAEYLTVRLGDLHGRRQAGAGAQPPPGIRWREGCRQDRCRRRSSVVARASPLLRVDDGNNPRRRADDTGARHRAQRPRLHLQEVRAGCPAGRGRRGGCSRPGEAGGGRWLVRSSQVLVRSGCRLVAVGVRATARHSA